MRHRADNGADPNELAEKGLGTVKTTSFTEMLAFDALPPAVRRFVDEECRYKISTGTILQAMHQKQNCTELDVLCALKTGDVQAERVMTIVPGEDVASRKPLRPRRLIRERHTMRRRRR